MICLGAGSAIQILEKSVQWWPFWENGRNTTFLWFVYIIFSRLRLHRPSRHVVGGPLSWPVTTTRMHSMRDVLRSVARILGLGGLKYILLLFRPPLFFSVHCLSFPLPLPVAYLTGAIGRWPAKIFWRLNVVSKGA